jgi:hypothetical protein
VHPDYLQGFLDKCAAHGINPESLVKYAQRYTLPSMGAARAQHQQYRQTSGPPRQQQYLQQQQGQQAKAQELRAMETQRQRAVPSQQAQRAQYQQSVEQRYRPVQPGQMNQQWANQQAMQDRRGVPAGPLQGAPKRTPAEAAAYRGQQSANVMAGRGTGINYPGQEARMANVLRASQQAVPRNPAGVRQAYGQFEQRDTARRAGQWEAIQRQRDINAMQAGTYR